MDNYIAYHLKSQDEIVLALLSQFPFESFEERQDETVAYIAEENHVDETKNSIAELLRKRSVAFTTALIAPQNWNAEWEASFQPVAVDQFCLIRADFHPADPSFEHEIVINPKMAFGTGHHETTFMMIQKMKELSLVNKRIFDYGCGTGILAIMASKLGAVHIDAIDIEEESYLNTVENAEINRIENIYAAEATLESFDGDNYDIILANINRHVLLNTNQELRARLNAGGTLLISGILQEDEAKVKDSFQANGWKHISSANRGNWLCMEWQ